MDDRTKYNVSKNDARRTCNGIKFDSEMEMKYYRDVILPQVESGAITYYELQKPYELQPKFIHDDKTVQAITYVADFYVEYANGDIEVLDTKGCPDSISKLKRKMFWYKYPDIVYKWICYSKIDGGWCDYERVKAGRNLRRKLRRLQSARSSQENED